MAAGVVVIVGGSTLVDVVLHVVRVYPPMPQPIGERLCVLATSYRLVIGVIGAWLTARLAPDEPMRLALILGYVGVVLASIGAAATWNMGLGPHWFPLALVALSIPQCWAGGKIFEVWR